LSQGAWSGLGALLERSLEILVRRCAKEIFGGDWRLVAEQLSLSSGRLDLLFADGSDQRHVLELKKGRADQSAIAQVLGYAQDLTDVLDGAVVVPWIVANEIPDRTRKAADSRGVRTRSISPAECLALMASCGLTDAELFGSRRATGVLHGGAKCGLKAQIPNIEAFKEMPGSTASLLERLTAEKHYQVRSGKMQTVVHYRGIQLGGINRKHHKGVAYLLEGCVLSSDFERALESLGYRRCSKVQPGHQHVWWQCSFHDTTAIGKAFKAASEEVDRFLLRESVSQ
jgi:hypothetical protein